MEALYLSRSKAALAIVAAAFVIFGITALVWPMVGIMLFACTLAVFAIGSALSLASELAIASDHAVRRGPARPSKVPAGAHPPRDDDPRGARRGRSKSPHP